MASFLNFSSPFSLHRARALGIAALTLTLGCGDSTGTSSASGDATAGSSGQTAGSTGTSATGSTGDPATTSGASMGDSTGPATTGPGTTGPGTTGPGTTGPATTGPATTGDSTGAVSETDGSTGQTSSDTTGGPSGATCESDADCSLFTSCCDCDVIADGETPPACNIMECLIDVCSTYDLKDSKPVCRFGRCTFSKVSCNPAGIICKALPPDCGPGTLPTLNDNGDCWSGQCAPIEACDWAPDCASCVDKQDPLVCVFKAQKGAYHVCEPKPAACGDMAEIDCGCGAEICEKSPPHVVCHDTVPGISCECPNC